MNSKSSQKTTMKTKQIPWNKGMKSVPSHKRIALIEQGREALEMYYDTIGQEYNADDRQFKHSQPRMAFGMALTKHLGDSLSSEILKKDRTTVIHYKNNHESNMSGWDGYATFFETAEYVVDTYFDGMAKINRIQYIDRLVSKLLQEKILIQSNINV